MNFVHILGIPAMQDIPKWTDIAQAMGSLVQAFFAMIMAIPVIATFFDFIDEKMQKNGGGINPKRAFKKTIKLINRIIIIALSFLQILLPNSVFFQKILQKIKERNNQLQDKINALKIRSKFRQDALIWLSRETQRETLAQTACQSISSNPREIELLYNDIRNFLELIYQCLDNFVSCNSLSMYIDGLPTPLDVSVNLYISAVDSIREEARKNLSPKAAWEVEYYLEYIKRKFRTK